MNTWALFWDADGLNMYKKIDSGLQEYQAKLIYQELKGNKNEDTILSSINQQLLIDGIWECLDSKTQISQADIEDLVSGPEPVKKLFDLVDASCKNTDWELTTTKLASIQASISSYYIAAVQRAEKKIENIQALWNIGLYSDGILENSGFDLVTDLEEIDTIIFASKNKYEWVDYYDLSEQLDSLSEDNQTSFKKSTDPEYQPVAKTDNILIPASSIDNNIDTLAANSSHTTWISNKYICPVWNNDILQSLNNVYWIGVNTNSSSHTNKPLFDGSYQRLRGDDVYSNGSLNSLDDLENFEFQTYQTINDNSSWPCNWFFCVVTEFVTYNHTLLTGADNITLEYLVSRSNDHLKKFTHTALTPATMTVNNFELWFKDLNLPDLFNVWIQIQSKPVPILKLDSSSPEDEKKDKSDAYSIENQLQEYFWDMWLDYTRINDLQIYQDETAKIKSLALGRDGTIVNAASKLSGWVEQSNLTLRKAELRDKQIQEHARWLIYNQFSNHLIEIAGFTKQIEEYSENLLHIVIKIKQIPTDKS